MIDLTPFQDRIEFAGDKVLLDVGSGGPTTDKRFIGIDPYAEGAEISAFAWDLPFDDNSVQGIFCSHLLEHIEKRKIVETLHEFHRVLKDGGQLEIVIPDLVWCCLYWINHQDNDWSLDIIYGNQKHAGEFHKTGFSIEMIRFYLMWSGSWEVPVCEYFGGTLDDAQTVEYADSVTGRMIRVIALKVGDPEALTQEKAVWEDRSTNE